MDINSNQETIKKDLSDYKVHFENYKPMVGWMEKDKTVVYFSINANTWYVKFANMSLVDASKLKDAFNSLASDYKADVSLNNTTVSIVLSKNLTYSKLVLPPDKPENTANTQQLQKVILLNKQREEIERMKIDVEVIKIKGLILQQKLKQAEMIKKSLKP